MVKLRCLHLLLGDDCLSIVQFLAVGKQHLAERLQVLVLCALHHMHLYTLKVIYWQMLARYSQRCRIDFLSDHHYAECPGIIVYVVRNNLSLRKMHFLIDESDDMPLEIALLHHAYGQYHGRQHCHYGNRVDDALHLGLVLMVDIGFLLKLHDEDRTNQCGKGDEDGVDQEKIERTCCVCPVGSSKTESHRTQWWHQGGGNGNTRNHIARFLAVAAQCNDTCQTTTEGNQNVVDGR